MGHALLKEKPHIGAKFLDRPKSALERAASRWGLKEKSSLFLRIASDKTLPGQYFDEETNLHYNRFRYFSPDLGRYITSDPLGLLAGPNTYNYVAGNPIRFDDPEGLYLPFWHRTFTEIGAAKAGLDREAIKELAQKVVDVDKDSYIPGTQDPENAHMHAMCAPDTNRADCQKAYLDYIKEQMGSCTQKGLARSIHAAQDFYASGHRNYKKYYGFYRLPPSHVYGDAFPSEGEVTGVPFVTQNIIEQFQERCSCN